MHESDIATPLVHRISPPPGDLEKHAPLLLARVHARLLGNVVAVVDDDRYLRELDKLREGHGWGSNLSAAEGNEWRRFPFGKRKVGARLEGDDAADVSVPDCRE